MNSKPVAFVTGGAEGIGAASVQALSAEGYSVYYCDSNNEKGRARLNFLNNHRISANFIHLDVRDRNGWKTISDKLAEEGVELDLLVNNAGIADPHMDFPAESGEVWEKVIGTNLSGVFLASNYLVPLMKRGSAIINIASTRAYQSERNTLPYSASKGGVLAFTHSLSMTLSEKGIRVNSISPGWIDTSEWHIPPEQPDFNRLDHLQHPSGRIGKPEDVANLVVFLASGKGEWINGQDIVIDGGMTRRMIYFDRDVMEEAISQLSGDEEFASDLVEKAFNRKQQNEPKK